MRASVFSKKNKELSYITKRALNPSENLPCILEIMNILNRTSVKMFAVENHIFT